MFYDPVVKQESHDHWMASTPVPFSKHLHEYRWGELRLFAFNLFFPVDHLRKSYQMALTSLISLDLTVRTVASSVAHMLAVLVCGTKTDVMGISRLYAVHDHDPGGDAERGVCGGDLACDGGRLSYSLSFLGKGHLGCRSNRLANVR